MLEKNMFVPDINAYSLLKVISECVAILERQAENQQIKIKLLLPKKDLQVKLDELRTQ
jgi:hypothetical protein